MRNSAEILEILDSFLKEKKLSRRQFNSLVDIPHSTLGNWKTKHTVPTVELVSKIAKFMNVSLDWLVNGDELENEQESKRALINTYFDEVKKYDSLDNEDKKIILKLMDKMIIAETKRI